MVLGEAIGSVAIGASGVWGYNRENFMYDREMRQKQEFTVVGMRLKQADLWREDVRDMLGLTEKKMDSYMVVNCLQIGFIITLFTEGRLEPGTPEWLLWLYMLSLSGAFVFLLQSIWFAMHASIVAQGSSTRLLTQLVRPAIPSWEQLEAMRTYAYAYEAVPAAQMLRVPILQTMSEGAGAGSGGYSGHADAPPGSAAADPWGLERRGDDIYELQRRPLPAARHMKLIREAMRHSQAYDAFARVSMTLGTIMLCQALTYYILGYCLIQDGSPWAAWTAVVVFQAVSSILLRLDLSLGRVEHRLSQFLLLGGPVLACIAGAEWAMYQRATQMTGLLLLPGCYLSHTFFLFLFLQLCHAERQPGGAILPMAFRSILYLDVFGWLAKNPPHFSGGSFERSYSPLHAVTAVGGMHSGYADCVERDVDGIDGLDYDCSASQTGSRAASSMSHGRPDVMGVPTGGEGHSYHSHGRRARLAVVHGQNFPRAWHNLPVALRPEDVDRALLSPEDPHGGAKAHQEASAHLLDDIAKFDAQDPDTPLPGVGPAGVIPEASERAFLPDSYHPGQGLLPQLVSGREEYTSGHLPWYIFRASVVLLACFWLSGGVWVVGQILGVPDIPDEVLPASVAIFGNVANENGEASADGAGGMASFFSGPRDTSVNDFLPEGERMLTEWPSERFQPWGFSSDPTGRRIAISDEFQLYFGFVEDLNAATFGEEMSIFRLTGVTPAPICPALEGQATRDVGIVCEALHGTPQKTCKALVLHERGTRLAECDLMKQPPPAAAGSWSRSLESDPAEMGARTASSQDGATGEEGGRVWRISTDWLRTEQGAIAEEVVSVAIDNDCNRSLSRSLAEGKDVELALPQEGGNWCIIAGTNHGRLVRLRRHARKRRLLVPAGVLWSILEIDDGRRKSPEVITTSLLHVLPGGKLVNLRNDRRSVHALDAGTGRIIGEWRLPDISGHTWSALAGGDGDLQIVSQRLDGNRADLWRFPVPPQLRDVIGFNGPP